MSSVRARVNWLARLKEPQSYPALSIRLKKLILVRIDPQGSSFVFEPGARPIIGIDSTFRHIPDLTSTLHPNTPRAARFHLVPPLIKRFSFQIKIPVTSLME